MVQFKDNPRYKRITIKDKNGKKKKVYVLKKRLKKKNLKGGFRFPGLDEAIIVDRISQPHLRDIPNIDYLYKSVNDYMIVNNGIPDYLIKDNILLKHKLALLDEIMRKIKTENEVPVTFIRHLFDNFEEFPFNEKLILYQASNQLQSKFNEQVDLPDYHIKLTKNLLINHYNTDLKDVDYQKYLSDDIHRFMGGDDFLEFATPYVVDSQEIEGMVYTYINILSESIYNGSPELQGLNSVELGMRILSAWVEKYPQNQRLINKKNKFQSFMNNYY